MLHFIICLSSDGKYLVTSPGGGGGMYQLMVSANFHDVNSSMMVHGFKLPRWLMGSLGLHSGSQHPSLRKHPCLVCTDLLRLTGKSAHAPRLAQACQLDMIIPKSKGT